MIITKITTIITTTIIILIYNNNFIITITTIIKSTITRMCTAALGILHREGDVIKLSKYTGAKLDSM